jgi:hypothetical protein
MMDRRVFLKLTGFAAAAGALGAFPASAAAAPVVSATESVRDLVAAPRLTVTRLAMREAGEYRVSGTIRLEAPTVEISGIANSQQISWSGADGQPPMLVSFTSFEQYDGLGAAPAISVRGGKLESLTVTPIAWL